MSAKIHDMPEAARLPFVVTYFNRTFDYHLRLPMEPATIVSMAELARLRGRKDIADLLMEALAEAKRDGGSEREGGR